MRSFLLLLPVLFFVGACDSGMESTDEVRVTLAVPNAFGVSRTFSGDEAGISIERRSFFGLACELSVRVGSRDDEGYAAEIAFVLPLNADFGVGTYTETDAEFVGDLRYTGVLPGSTLVETYITDSETLTFVLDSYSDLAMSGSLTVTGQGGDVRSSVQATFDVRVDSGC
ncbi:MAG: hypothetical protein AAGI52_00840 [Bacteroidota bacterium]